MSGWRLLVLSVALVSSLSGLVRGDESSSPIQIVTRSGESITAIKLAALDSQQLQYVTEASTVTLARKEIFSLRRQAPATVDESTERTQVKLIQRELWQGEMIVVDETELTLKWSPVVGPSATLRIPLEQIREIRTPLYPQRVRGLNAPPEPLKGNGDKLRLVNGDLLRGDLQAIDSERLMIRIGEVETEVPWGNLASLEFNPELGVLPEPSDQSALISLADGGTLTLSELRLDDNGTFSGRTSFEQPVSIASEAVASVLFLSNETVCLSEIPFDEPAYTPFLTGVMPLRLDANVLGNELAISGEPFLRGVGMHSRTQVTWTLHEDYSHLLVSLGLDDAAGDRGDVVFRLKTDLQTEPAAFARRSGEPPLLIRHDLTGAKRLTLEVDFGNGGSLQDFADWGDPFLFRSPSPAVQE